MADTVLPAGDAPRPAHSEPARRPQRDPASTALASVISVVVTIVGLLFLAWLILYVTKGRFLKHTFEKYASRFAERDIRVAGDFNFYFDPIDVKFLAEGLTVTNPKWASKPLFFQSKKIDTRVATIPLIFGTRRINWLELAGGDLNLEWDKEGKRNTWTFGDPNAKGEPFQMPIIRRAIVSGTMIHYRMPHMQISADVKFDTIKAQDTRFASSIGFTGSGSARGTPFRLWGRQSTPNELLNGGRNQFELHATAVDARVDVAGTLPGATELEGSDLTVGVRGKNLRRLFDLAGIAVPDTRAYRLTSHLTKTGDEWRFTRLRGNYGASDIGGKMTISFPSDRLLLVADLASRNVDIVDIGPFIGYNPTALATKGATAAVAQTGGTPRILPDAPLRIDAISAFDAKVTYKVRDIRQPFVPVSNISLGLDLDHKLLKLSPLTLDLAGGHLSADISIDARVPAVVTDYDIRLSPTPMGKLFRGFGVEESGTTGTLAARIKMKGTGDTVRDSLASSDGRIAIVLPAGTFWTRNIQLAEFDIGTFVQKMFEKKLKEPVQINCGLVAFTVRNGVAAADPILIDTAKNVMTAKGGFSFRDESMDLRFRADSKKFSLFSGQSPVGIAGYFAAPRLQIITPELLARGGVGLGLGLAAGPLGAMLAFVDVGDAKSAQCGPVLAGATAAAQRTSKGEARKDVGTRAGNAKDAGDRKQPTDKKILGIF